MTQGTQVRYRYELQSADAAGETRHPQIVISEHFPDATEMEGHSIGDCWLFRAQEHEAPAYFVVLPAVVDLGALMSSDQEEELPLNVPTADVVELMLLAREVVPGREPTSEWMERRRAWFASHPLLCFAGAKELFRP